MAPGSKDVTDYYERAGLWPYLEKLDHGAVVISSITSCGNGPSPSTHLEQDRFGAVAVLHTGGEDDDGQQQTQGCR